MVTKTVKSSGGDYTSLQSAVTAWAAANADWDIECYASVGEDNPVVVPSGETNSLRIYTPLTERHSGKPSTSCYRIGTESFAFGIEVQSPNVIVEGILFLPGNSNSNVQGGIKLNAAVSWNIEIRECFFNSIGTGNPFPAIDVADGTGGTVKVRNCISVASTTGGNSALVRNASGSGYTTNVYNCTARSSYTGGFGVLFYQNSIGTMVCKNCVGSFVTASSNTCFLGTITGNNNISSDSTAPGTSAQTSANASYVDSANWDLHLADGDTIAKAHGADLSADGWSIDIDSQTRTGTWDAGADQVVTVSTVGTTAASRGAGLGNMGTGLTRAVLSAGLGNTG